VTASVGTIGTSWMPTAAGSPESDSREYNNIQQGHQQQQHELTTRILATEAKTADRNIASTA
jgi:hypothetical protein